MRRKIPSDIQDMPMPFNLEFYDRIPEGTKATHWDSYRMLSRFGKGVTLWFSGNEDERESVILHHHESRTRWKLLWGEDNERHAEFINSLIKLNDAGLM